ncbi:MAG: hypothetical protein IPP93_18615 [Chitinophagaceae bacterium]|nr:hypothetical protein [Chitinophagaceae bacterium]
MDVTVAPVSVNTIQFTLTGTHDDNDLPNVAVYFNAVTPDLSGATQLVGTIGTWVAPHTYILPANRTIGAGGSGYFMITVDVAASATNGNTVKLNGAVNPVLFGYTTVPALTNNQTDAAGIQTIQIAGVTLTTTALVAASIMQGTSNNPVYVVKMDAVITGVTINSIQFTLTGTHDNNDLTTISIYFNDVNPTVTGATFLNSSPGNFAAPHTYTFRSVEL